MNIDTLSQSLKDLKTTAIEKYVYTTKDKFFGSIIFSINTTYINFINLDYASDEYFNKMISISCIKNGLSGYETNFGVLEQGGYTYQYSCRQTQKKAMEILSSFKEDMSNATFVHKITNLQENERFYNDILLRKSDEGAGKFIISNVTGMSDKVLYIAPCMLPASKTTPLDLVIYDIPGNNYFVVVFISHKNTGDVKTMMRFLNV
jgi:hypothetical protein